MAYSTDDWSDAYHHDYQYEIGREVGALSKTMQAPLRRCGDGSAERRWHEKSSDFGEQENEES